MKSQERRKKRSAPVKINKDIYLTAAQKADRNKLYDECERFCSPDALRWFREPPYQLKYLEMIGQADQGKSNDAETADQRTEGTEKK